MDDQRLKCLEVQVRELRRQNKFLLDWHDTFNTPVYKRLWWFVLGYKFFALGTWYNATWNVDGQEYN